MREESLVSNSKSSPVIKKLDFSESFVLNNNRNMRELRMESHLETIVYRVHLFEEVRGFCLLVLCSFI